MARATNAVSSFATSTEYMFGQLDIIIHLDDLLGHAKTKNELLEKIGTVFTVCREKRLKLNPMKCDVVTLEVFFLQSCYEQE